MSGEIAPFVTDTPEGVAARAKLSKQQVTVVFVDLVGSTEYASEMLQEDYQILVGRYHNVVAAEIEAHKGEVRRIRGDEIVGVFGYPAMEEAAVHAVAACLSALEQLKELNKEFEDQVSHPITARIGVASGVVSAGSEYDQKKVNERPLFGDTPNRAQRLQLAATPGAILISERTHSLLGNTHKCSNLGQRELRGLPGLATIWRVDRETRGISRFDAHRGAALAPFTARKRELEILVSSWEATLGGSPQVVWIEGEPGIGKSRLIREFTDNRCSAPVHTVQFQSTRTNAPYYPIKEFVSQATRLTSFDSEDQAVTKIQSFSDQKQLSESQCHTLLRFLDFEQSAKKETDNTSDIDWKTQTRETIVKIFSELGRVRPQILIIEDLHWADPSSREFLNALVKNEQHKNLLIVFTTRPLENGDSDISQSLFGTVGVTEIRLTPFSNAESVTLLEALNKDRGGDKQIIEEIQHRGDGIPLFIEELHETRRLNVERSPSGDKELPVKLLDLLMSQLDRLPYDALQLARIAAAIGSNISRKVLKQLSNLDDYDFQISVEALLDTGLMVAIQHEGSERLRFKHAMVQGAAYSSMLRDSRKVQLHNQIIDLLSSEYMEIVDSQPDFFAYQLMQAEQFDQSVQWWIRAAEFARKDQAPKEELNQLDKALHLVEKHLPKSNENDNLKLELLLRKGAVFASQSSYADPELESLYQDTIAICKELGAKSELVDSLTGLSAYYYVKGELDSALRWAHEAHSIALRSEDPGRLIETHRLLGEIMVYTGDLSWSRYHLEKCIHLYQRDLHGDNSRYAGDDPGVLAHMYLGICLYFLGFTDSAKQINAAGMSLAETLHDDFHTYAQAQFYSAWLYGLLEDYSNCVSFARAAINLCEKYEVEMFLGTSEVLLGWALLNLGEEEGEIPLKHGMQSLMESDARLTVGSFISFHAEGLILTGQNREALRDIEEQLKPNVSTDTYLHLERVRIRARLKNLIDADASSYESEIRRALAQSDSTDNTSIRQKITNDLVRFLEAQGRNNEITTLIASVFQSQTVPSVDSASLSIETFDLRMSKKNRRTTH